MVEGSAAASALATAIDLLARHHGASPGEMPDGEVSPRASTSSPRGDSSTRRQATGDLGGGPICCRECLPARRLNSSGYVHIRRPVTFWRSPFTSLSGAL